MPVTSSLPNMLPAICFNETHQVSNLRCQFTGFAPTQLNAGRDTGFRFNSVPESDFLLTK